MACLPRLGALLAGCILCGPVAGQNPTPRGTPGSLLLYPEIDARPGLYNIVTVTNTERAASNLSQVTFMFVDRFGCVGYDVRFPLGPGDTLSLITGAVVPFFTEGYCYAWATDSADRPIVHNHLIGTSTIVDGLEALEYTMEPLPFLGIGDGMFTDLNNNTSRDLDGVEYSMAPASQLIPRFMGQGQLYESDLIMIDLTGGAGRQVTVDFTIYNDNGQAETGGILISCWWKTDLLDISAKFGEIYLQSQTAQDPTEIFGWPAQESGWFRADGGLIFNGPDLVGTDPAIVCVLVEKRLSNSTQTSVHAVSLGGQANARLPSHDLPLPPPAAPGSASPATEGR